MTIRGTVPLLLLLVLGIAAFAGVLLVFWP